MHAGKLEGMSTAARTYRELRRTIGKWRCSWELHLVAGCRTTCIGTRASEIRGRLREEPERNEHVEVYQHMTSSGSDYYYRLARGPEPEKTPKRKSGRHLPEPRHAGIPGPQAEPQRSPRRSTLSADWRPPTSRGPSAVVPPRRSERPPPKRHHARPPRPPGHQAFIQEEMFGE